MVYLEYGLVIRLTFKPRAVPPQMYEEYKALGAYPLLNPFAAVVDKDTVC